MEAVISFLILLAMGNSLQRCYKGKRSVKTVERLRQYRGLFVF
jgi:hypothetical protein